MSKKLLFPNLNTLRFIAASLVIIHHIEIYKSFFHLNNLWNVAFFQVIGKLGVVLFFVLSGFLITSLLLHERKNTGTVSLKNFYVRRILRIWPVYYLIIFLGFFVYPYLPFFDIPNKAVFPNVLENRIPNLFFYLGIFANLGWAIFKDVPYTSQTWSLATEEQFYVFWPLLILLFYKRKLFVAMTMVVLTYWLVKYFSDISTFLNHYFSPKTLEYLRNFWYSFNVNCMAIGSLFAYLVFKKKNILQFFYQPFVFGAACASTITLLLVGKNFGFFHYDIYAILFGITIVNLACNRNYSDVLEHKTTNYLGSISYGMYMYHFPMLTIAIKIGNYTNSHYIVVYTLTFVLTIIASHFSYNYYEKYFLKLKDKFI